MGSLVHIGRPRIATPKVVETKSVTIGKETREVRAYLYENLSPRYRANFLRDSNGEPLFATRIRLEFPRVDWYIRATNNAEDHITSECGSGGAAGSGAPCPGFNSQQLVPALTVPFDAEPNDGHGYTMYFNKRPNCDSPQELSTDDLVDPIAGGGPTVIVNDSYWDDNHGSFDVWLYILG